MGRPAALSRDRIVEAAAHLVGEHGAEALTARRLGEALSCDPTAIYRHFADLSEVRREVGDHFLAAVKVAARGDEPWDATVHRICVQLRAVQLVQPRMAALVRSAPTLLANELRITNALLGELERGGFEPPAAARAYHALIELTVGSAAIDAELAAQPALVRRRAYRSWRERYATLDQAQYPHAVAAAGHLYDGTADTRFDFALTTLLAALPRFT